MVLLIFCLLPIYDLALHRFFINISFPTFRDLDIISLNKLERYTRFLNYNIILFEGQPPYHAQPPKKIYQNFIKTAFLCHGPLPFPTRPPLLPLSRTGRSGQAMIGLSRTCHYASPHVYLK